MVSKSRNFEKQNQLRRANLGETCVCGDSKSPCYNSGHFITAMICYRLKVHLG